MARSLEWKSIEGSERLLSKGSSTVPVYRSRIHPIFLSLLALVFLCPILLALPGCSPAEQLKEISFDELKSVNTKNRESIPMILLRFSSLNETSQTEADTKRVLERMDVKRQAISNDNSLSKSKKEAQLRSVDQLAKYLLVKHRAKQSQHTLILDHKGRRFRDETDETKLISDVRIVSGAETGTPTVEARLKIARTFADGKMRLYQDNFNLCSIDEYQDDLTEPYLLYLGLIDESVFLETYASIEHEMSSYNGRAIEIFHLVSGATGGKEIKTNLSVDPKLAYRLVRQEIIVDGLLAQEIKADSYKVFGGVPIPTQYSLVQYAEATGERTVMRVDNVSVDDALIIDTVSDSIFKAAYPAGAKIGTSASGQEKIASGDEVGEPFLLMPAPQLSSIPGIKPAKEAPVQTPVIAKTPPKMDNAEQATDLSSNRGVVTKILLVVILGCAALFIYMRRKRPSV